MAPAFALEPPTLRRSWEAFVAHLPTLLVVWLVSGAISAIGSGLSVLTVLVGLGPAALDPAALSAGALEPSTPMAATALLLSQAAQVPLTVLSSLVGVLLMAVPALHYATGRVITLAEAFQLLRQRPWRYLLAGLAFALITAAGLLLCLLPGFAVLLVGPVFVNRIFTTNETIEQAFARSWQAVFRSPHGMTFIGVQALVGSVVLVAAICTCGTGALVAVPVGNFYLQNSAYHLGLIR
ncbi:MAG: hypothetical protein VKJ66_11345 [Synechococcus sp.]|nr:hypothetical protein [Synechococcus sp.]